MNPFNRRVFAAILVILLPMTNIASAGTSRSMKSGFSSQKSSSQRANLNNNARSSPTSFGSFGQQRSDASSRSNSALNRDLEKNQAQQQALKNMDARNQQKAFSRPEQQTSVTGKPLSAAQTTPQVAPQVAPQITTAPVAPTVIVQREGSSMGAAFVGFMLGQAMSRPHSVPAPPSYDTRRNDLEPIASGDDASYKNGAVNIPAVREQVDNTSANVVVTPAKVTPVENESSAWAMLRFLVWMTILSGLGWLIYKVFRFFVPRREAVSHYSLGKV